ncbi:MAG: pentapeptide repeat-containing protein [Planctomycetes bacterium]|nr:pentapeptide repeat-containing protein [Planctomycetota bacterium]
MSDDSQSSDDPTPEVHASASHHGPGDTRPEMPASDVYELIKAGKPVENVRVRRLKLKGEFPATVTFKNCVLSQMEVGAATFRGDLTFVGCSLDRPIFGKPVTVEGHLGFNACTVSKSRFFQLTVVGKAFFNGAEFRGKAYFEKCVFRQKVSWWEAKLECWGEFKSCEFYQDADFRSVHCDQGLIFTGCTFADDFLLRGATVHKKFQADGCRFEKLFDMSKAKLHDFVYLEGIEQGPEMKFAFANAVAERLLVRPEQVEGRLASELSGQHEQAMHEYGLLKKCCQGQHRFNDEDWAFYRFKVNQRLATKASWNRPWTKVRRFCDWLFLDIGCGYGTNPARAVRMAVVIILGFATLYGAGVEQFHAEKLPFPDDEVTDTSNRVMIGLITSVSVFTSGMGGIREIAKGWMNVPVMVESVLGTLLFGLFIVAFSRKVIR